MEMHKLHLDDRELEVVRLALGLYQHVCAAMPFNGTQDQVRTRAAFDIERRIDLLQTRWWDGDRSRFLYLGGLKMSYVADRVRKIAVEHLGVEESKVTPQASFTGDLGADSLDFVELSMAYEDAFGVEIVDDDAMKLVTVQDAVDYIEAKLPVRSESGQ